LWPKLSKGVGALESASAEWDNFCVVTTLSPWRLARSRMPDAQNVIFADSLQRDRLKGMVEQTDEFRLIVGLGSGLAMDTAKYLAKAKQSDLVQVLSLTLADLSGVGEGVLHTLPDIAGNFDAVAARP